MAACEARWYTGRSRSRMAGVSRSAPSVTTPVAPRRAGPQHEDVADRAGVGLAARLDHEHLVGSQALDGAALGVLAGAQRRPGGPPASGRSAACGRSPTIRWPSRTGRSPLRNVLRMPRCCSWNVSVAVDTRCELGAQLVGQQRRSAPLRSAS